MTSGVSKLKQSRVELGLSQSQIAAAMNVSMTAYNSLETSRTSPLTRRGEWREVAVTVSDFHGISLSEMFSAEADQIKSQPQLCSPLRDSYPSVHEQYEESETCKRVLEILKKRLLKLTDREQFVLRSRFGFDEDPKTLREIGSILGIRGEPVRQIEARALRRLRHHNSESYELLSLLDFVPYRWPKHMSPPTVEFNNYFKISSPTGAGYAYSNDWTEPYKNRPGYLHWKIVFPDGVNKSFYGSLSEIQDFIRCYLKDSYVEP